MGMAQGLSGTIIVIDGCEWKIKRKRIVFYDSVRRCDASRIHFLCVSKDFLVWGEKSKIRANLSVLEL